MLPLWKRLTLRKERRAKLYRQYRRKGFYLSLPDETPKPVDAWKAAKIAERWARWERSGLVRLRKHPDEFHALEIDRDELNTDLTFCEEHGLKPEYVGLVGEYRDVNGRWQHADSCWGFIGYRDPADPLENAYAADIMAETIRQANEARFTRCERWAESVEAGDFVEGYCTALLWTLSDEDMRKVGIRQTSGEFMPPDHWLKLFTRNAWLRIYLDCRRFVRDTVGSADRFKIRDTSAYSAAELAGHDFWLTREGHGTGFWDRDERWGKMTDKLTETAKRFGEANPYVIGRRIYF